MVHSAALREAHGNVPVAEDVTQAVFTQLARGASKLVSHPAIAGWLYTCVRLTAANARRADERRQRREQEAAKMNELCGPTRSDPVWQQVMPILDDVMHELDEEDRAAVVLRFFEERSLKEVGASLGLSENTARMRVERSLEKLHRLLTQRGVKSTAATLAAVLVAGTAVRAPAALVSKITAAALGSSAAGAGAGAALVSKFLQPANAKAAAAVALAALAAVFFTWRHVVSQSTLKTSSPPPGVAASEDSIKDGSTQTHSNAMAVVSANNVSLSQMNFNVVDAATGKPLAGAKLRMTYYLNSFSRYRTIKAVSDANGRMAVGMLGPPYADLYLFVTADGYVPKLAVWGRMRPMPFAYTMKLARGTTIGGSVVDGAGHPIVGARIGFSTGNDPVMTVESIAFGPDAWATTDSNGHWSCNMIPPGETIRLDVAHSEHAPTNLTVKSYIPDANRLIITMSYGLRIGGTVRDSNGGPIAGALVRQVDGSDDTSTTTDFSGAFEFRNVEAGQQMIAVQADGFAPAVQTFETSSNVETLRFQLGPGQRVRGRVVDDQGNPVAGAMVQVMSRHPAKMVWSTNSGADGRFEWDSAPVEAQQYSVTADGFDSPDSLRLPADGSEQDIRLARSQTTERLQVTGTVVDSESGLPLDNFNVYVSEMISSLDGGDGPFMPCFYAVENDGHLNVSIPSTWDHRRYRIQIEKEGYLPAVSSSFLRADGNQTLELAMQKGAGPYGIVFLPGGQPAVNATVFLCTSLAGVTMDDAAHAKTGLNTTTYKTETDGAGNFSLRPAIEPDGLVIIHDQGYATVSATGMTAGAHITLQPWGRVQGQLLVDSKPAANEQIHIIGGVKHFTSTGRPHYFVNFNFEATTDADGKFCFKKVPPGQWKVFQPKPVSFSTLAALEATADVKAGELTEVVLGGAGRLIVGRATLPGVTASIDWQRVPVHLESTNGSVPARKFGAICNSDGTFQLPNVPAGTYELQIKAFDAKLNSTAPHDFSEPTEILGSITRDVVVPEGQNSDPLDLGTLELKKQDASPSTL